MKQSVLLRRVLIATAVSALCVILFTVIIYGFVFQFRFSRNEGANLMYKAQVLGNLVTHWGKESDLDEAVARLDYLRAGDYTVFLEDYTFIYGLDGQLAATNADLAPFREFIDSLVKKALSGEEVLYYSDRPSLYKQTVLAGVPLIGEEGEIIGCLFMGQRMSDVLSNQSDILASSLASLVLASPFVALLMLFLMGKIIKPIRQMSDVANAMAAGDYEARADEHTQGEVRQLAHSLNDLCDQLTAKIAEVTLERDRVRQSVNSLSEGFLSLREGEDIYRNPALTEMFAEARGYTDDRLSIVPDERVWQALDAAMSRGGDSALMMYWGEKIYRVTITGIAPGGAVALFSDITENERLEKTRREYVANVSHELRSPLTAMRALVEPLRDGMVTSAATQNRYYGIILDEIQRLTRLIDDLLELSRLQSGQAQIELSPLSIVQMLSDLSVKYQALAQDKGQRFELFLPKDCPKVMGSEDWIGEVLVALLDNALKYTPEGGVIRLGARVTEKKVEVFVRDNGIGISAADKPYVFDRFFKADKAHRDKGSGLGLSLAKEILTLMGEEIKVVSSLGNGSEFYFTLTRCD